MSPSSEEYNRLQATLLQTMTQNPVPALRNAAWHTWNDVLDLTQVRGPLCLQRNLHLLPQPRRSWPQSTRQ